MAKYRIASLPGDGVGKDVLEAAMIVLEKIGLTYRWQITGLPEEHAAFEGVLYFDMTREEFEEAAGR